jgi:hypothetical protein
MLPRACRLGYLCRLRSLFPRAVKAQSVLDICTKLAKEFLFGEGEENFSNHRVTPWWCSVSGESRYENVPTLPLTEGGNGSAGQFLCLNLIYLETVCGNSLRRKSGRFFGKLRAIAGRNLLPFKDLTAKIHPTVFLFIVLACVMQHGHHRLERLHEEGAQFYKDGVSLQVLSGWLLEAR